MNIRTASDSKVLLPVHSTSLWNPFLFWSRLTRTVASRALRQSGRLVCRLISIRCSRFLFVSFTHRVRCTASARSHRVLLSSIAVHFFILLSLTPVGRAFVILLSTVRDAYCIMKFTCYSVCEFSTDTSRNAYVSIRSKHKMQVVGPT